MPKIKELCVKDRKARLICNQIFSRQLQFANFAFEPGIQFSILPSTRDWKLIEIQGGDATKVPSRKIAIGEASGLSKASPSFS